MKDSGDKLESSAVPAEVPSAENMQKTNNSKLKSFSKLPPKRSLAIAAIAGLLLLGLYGLYTELSNRNTASTDSQVCSEKFSEEFVAQASQALKENDRVLLAKYRNQILKDKDYASNQNCLLILIKDRVAVGDTEEAKKYLDLLKKAYNPSVGYSKNFSVATPNPENIEKSIQLANSYEEAIQKQIRENSKVTQQLDAEADKNAPKQQ